MKDSMRKESLAFILRVLITYLRPLHRITQKIKLSGLQTKQTQKHNYIIYLFDACFVRPRFRLEPWLGILRDWLSETILTIDILSQEWKELMWIGGKSDYIYNYQQWWNEQIGQDIFCVRTYLIFSIKIPRKYI